MNRFLISISNSAVSAVLIILLSWLLSIESFGELTYARSVVLFAASLLFDWLSFSALRYWLGLILIPVFTLVEGWAGLRGFAAYLKDRLGIGRSELFEVISKTHETPLTTGGTRAA